MTEPTTEPTTELTRPRAAGRREAVLLALLGAVLIILACTRTWATVKVTGNLPGMSDLAVSGRRAAPAGIPVALAAAAGAVVLLTSGRLVRAVVAAGLAVAGALLTVSAVRATRDSSGAVAKALRDSLGVYSTGPAARSSSLADGSSVDISLWPWVAAVGAVLIVAAGLLVLIRGWSWPGPSRRYERPDQPVTAVPAKIGPAGTWDALSRGEDPTSRVEDPT
jgi:hypothetical protein